METQPEFERESDTGRPVFRETDPNSLFSMVHTARGKTRRLNGDQSRTNGAGLDDSSGMTPRGLKEEEGVPRGGFS